MARAQHRQNDLSDLSVMKQQLVVHKLTIKPIKHAQLLHAISGIIGGINVKDHFGAPGQCIHISAHLGPAQNKHVVFDHTVFEADVDRLIGQDTSQNIFKSGIFYQVLHIVAVFIALHKHKVGLLEQFF